MNSFSAFCYLSHGWFEVLQTDSNISFFDNHFFTQRTPGDKNGIQINLPLRRLSIKTDSKRMKLAGFCRTTLLKHKMALCITSWHLDASYGSKQSTISKPKQEEEGSTGGAVDKRSAFHLCDPGSISVLTVSSG